MRWPSGLQVGVLAPESGTLIRFISLLRFTSTRTMSSLPSRLPAKARYLPSGDHADDEVM